MKHLHGSLLGILHFVFPWKKKWNELILAISLNHRAVSCSLSSPLKPLFLAENRQRNKIRLAGETPLLKVFYEPLWWRWHSSLFMWELVCRQSEKIPNRIKVKHCCSLVIQRECNANCQLSFFKTIPHYLIWELAV